MLRMHLSSSSLTLCLVFATSVLVKILLHYILLKYHFRLMRNVHQLYNMIDPNQFLSSKSSTYLSCIVVSISSRKLSHCQLSHGSSNSLHIPPIVLSSSACKLCLLLFIHLTLLHRITQWECVVLVNTGTNTER